MCKFRNGVDDSGLRVENEGLRVRVGGVGLTVWTCMSISVVDSASPKISNANESGRITFADLVLGARLRV
jgi:hypothetical protein